MVDQGGVRQLQRLVRLSVCPAEVITAPPLRNLLSGNGVLGIKYLPAKQLYREHLVLVDVDVQRVHLLFAPASLKNQEIFCPFLLEYQS